jgi:hypothetical protein
MMMASRSRSCYSDDFWDSKSVVYHGKGKCLPAFWRDSGELYMVSVLLPRNLCLVINVYFLIWIYIFSLNLAKL